MVAAEAGVSLATASAAMRGLDIVKPSTREKVEAAALKLDYQRNSAAAVLSSLRNRRSQKQAFIVWLSAYAPSEQVGIDWDAGPRYATEEAQRLGLQFAAYNIDHPDEALRIMREIDACGCDGIVWGTSAYATAELPAMPWNRFSVVSTDEGRLKEGFDAVLANQFRSTLGLLRRVRQAGFKRIGICLREHAVLHSDDEVRYGAAAAFQLYDQAGEELIPIIRIQHDAPEAAALLVPWAREHKPDVVLGFGTEEIRILEEGGFRIPEDFSYVCLHVSEPVQGVLAGRKHNKEVVAEFAVRVLMEKMRHGIRGLSLHPQETEIIPPVMAGTSCPDLDGDPID